MSSKFMKTGLANYFGLAFLPSAALGIYVYMNRKEMAQKLESQIANEQQVVARSHEKFDEVKERSEKRKAEWAVFSKAGTVPVYSSVRRNYRYNEVNYNHATYDTYDLIIAQYDDGLTNPLLPYMKGVQYASPEYLKRKEESKKKFVERSNKNRDEVYADLVKKGAVKV